MKYDPKISPRMFQNNVLEWFSHIHPATPVIFWVPVIVVVSYIGMEHYPLWRFLFHFLTGMFLWSITEYTLHRWIFHYEPKSDWGKRLHFLMHGVHHDYPRDPSRLVMPLGISIPLGILFYSIFYFLVSKVHFGLFAGFATGYLTYDMIHYATHHFAMKGRIGRFLKVYHMRHHFNNPHRGYGVSSPLWDIVFGTKPPETPNNSK